MASISERKGILAQRKKIVWPLVFKERAEAANLGANVFSKSDATATLKLKTE